MPNDSYRRRMAIQIVASLPDNPEDANAVMRYAQELLDNFVAGGWYKQDDQERVLPFRVVPPSSSSS